MNNIIVLPMVLPLIVGVLLIFFRSQILLQRWATTIMFIVNSGISFVILHKIQLEGIIRLDFGEWLPPFGILFVADSFATLLVLTTNIISAICILYAMRTIGERRENLFFYSL